MPGDHDSSQGWVKLHRQINDCKALEGPACEKWAWADLMLLAAHAPTEVNLHLGHNGRYRVQLQRGEFCYGTQQLAYRWKWTRDVGRHFIAKLIREGMLSRRAVQGVPVESQADLFDSLLTGDTSLEIDLKSRTASRTGWLYVYRIVNYEVYQGIESGLGTASSPSLRQELSLHSKITSTKRTTESLELSSKGSGASSLPGDDAPGRALLRELGDLWNSLPGLIHHGRPALRAFDRKLSKALQVFGPEALKLAFGRYSKWRVNREGRYRAAYSWTLGEFVSRSEGSHVARLSSDGWESGCLPFGNETQEQANTRAAARARSAAGADPGGAGDKVEQAAQGEMPAWLRWGK